MTCRTASRWKQWIIYSMLRSGSSWRQLQAQCFNCSRLLGLVLVGCGWCPEDHVFASCRTARASLHQTLQLFYSPNLESRGGKVRNLDYLFFSWAEARRLLPFDKCATFHVHSRVKGCRILEAWGKVLPKGHTDHTRPCSTKLPHELMPYSEHLGEPRTWKTA